MAKCIIVAHRAAYMRRIIQNTLQKLGYEEIILDPVKCKKQERPGRPVPYLWEEPAVGLYRQHNAAALVVDPLFGAEGTRELLELCPDMVVIGCGTELNPKNNSEKEAAQWKKLLLDAGVKTTAILDLRDPAPLLKAALDEALQ